jgi:dTDP-4-dehydrorhamnose 3,5-epimerase
VSHRSDELFPRLLPIANIFKDSRGSVHVLYESSGTVLKRSSSIKGVLRGLHRQLSPSCQTKIIRVVKGRILDFIADPDDEDEVIWYSEIGVKDEWVVIDPKFSHGFYAIEDTVFEYFCEGQYDENLEETLFIEKIVSDELNLTDLIISNKDRSGKPFGKMIKKHTQNMINE